MKPTKQNKEEKKSKVKEARRSQYGKESCTRFEAISSDNRMQSHR
jgi:hypothetical protein